ncbi:MAG: hypothetical protein HZB56_01530 [Deltaproteobacteria bacterium]|nr:hypothetical protein [Deltaproteobacteria bacterium]
MTGRSTAAALALAGLAACATAGGRSRTFDATRLEAEPGWVQAAPTPAVRQQGASDCGAAALAMIAGRWQVPLSLDDAAAALPEVAPQGTRLGDLRDLARTQGLQAFAIAADRQTLLHELGAGRPVIVGLHVPAGSGRALRHYEVLVAAHPVEDRFVTLDPGSGWRVRSWSELEAEWLPAGHPALVVVGRDGGAAPRG